MKCPLCNHLSLPGADECEVCSASLTQDDVPRPATILQEHLHNDAVSVLDPSVPQKTSEDTRLDEAVAAMRRASIGCLVVTGEGGRLVGLLSERDLLQKVALETEELSTRTVGEVMTRRPETVREDHHVDYALQRMMVGDHRHLPVVDADGRPVGIVSSRDVVRYVEKVIEEARQQVSAAE